MNFKEREVDFREADRRYAELVRQREAGSISDEEYQAQRQQLMVKDDEGHWWAKLGESGEWHYRDGGGWVRGIPPTYYRGAANEPVTGSSPAQTPSAPPPQDTDAAKHRRRRVPSWAPATVIGLGGVVLVGIVLIFWVLVPYLRGEPEPGKQGGPMRGERGESAPSEQGESSPGGAVLEAAFVHHATPENISANSTYLDNPLINNDPGVILYITQNFNPEGGAGTYNDHPIGVWYDSNSQRWAIFNQDREPMPDGAAFNVAVLKGPT